jgi:glutamine synthetase adenylyltransferase
LQLRDNVKDDEVDRTTAATLRRLSAAGSLSEQNFGALDEGYGLLRSIDHQLRLIVGRSARLPLPEHPAFRDIARRAGFRDASELTIELSSSMNAIRAAYSEIVSTGNERDGS